MSRLSTPAFRIPEAALCLLALGCQSAGNRGSTQPQVINPFQTITLRDFYDFKRAFEAAGKREGITYADAEKGGKLDLLNDPNAFLKLEIFYLGQVDRAITKCIMQKTTSVLTPQDQKSIQSVENAILNHQKTGKFEFKLPL